MFRVGHQFYSPKIACLQPAEWKEVEVYSMNLAYEFSEGSISFMSGLSVSLKEKKDSASPW
jgi:hypothetical protein